MSTRFNEQDFALLKTLIEGLRSGKVSTVGIRNRPGDKSKVLFVEYKGVEYGLHIAKIPNYPYIGLSEAVSNNITHFFNDTLPGLSSLLRDTIYTYIATSEIYIRDLWDKKSKEVERTADQSWLDKVDQFMQDLTS